MAFGATSGIFQQAMLNPMLGRLWTTAAPTGFTSLSADTIKAALFGNTTTPSKAVTQANTCFGADQWSTTNEVHDAGANWPSGGLPLASKAFSIATDGSVCFQAAALSGLGAVTITNAYGCLVYDDTVSTPADAGLCYNSFGGSAQGVAAGSFTVLWATVGAFANTVVFNVTV